MLFKFLKNRDIATSYTELYVRVKALAMNDIPPFSAIPNIVHRLTIFSAPNLYGLNTVGRYFCSHNALFTDGNNWIDFATSVYASFYTNKYTQFYFLGIYT